MMKRIEAIAIIALEAESMDALLVGNIGYPSRELYAVGDRPSNFYMLGSMGLASSIGLGHDRLCLRRIGREPGDLHGVEELRGEPPHGDLARYRLSLATSMADDQKERDLVEAIQRGEGVDAVSKPRVLHHEGGPPAAEICPRTDPHTLLLPGDGDMSDLLVGGRDGDQAIEVDAGDAGDEVYACSFHTSVYGLAGIDVIHSDSDIDTISFKF